MNTMKRVMSGIQPTGKIHFGNYFGAIRNWVSLQEEYQCYFSIVDYHAITMPYDPVKLRQNTWDLAINLLACGVKEECLFVQSMVPEHTELAWILSSVASYGQVTRMTQFKDKSRDAQAMSEDQFISTGLFTYPVLQAADILIYRAEYVPVGQDQQQHLELTRNIAERFNHQFGKEFFPIPEALFTETPKIMSTADPSRKMSKSAGDKHNIDIFADESRIRNQIRSAVTDTGDQREGEMSPGVANLFSLIKACGNMDSYQELMKLYDSGNLSYKDLKEVTADGLVQESALLVSRRKELLENKKEIKNKIKYHSMEIRKEAQETLKAVKELAGLMNAK